MSKPDISIRVIIAIAFLFGVFPEVNSIAACLFQPYETFPAAYAPEAVTIGNGNHDEKIMLHFFLKNPFPGHSFFQQSLQVNAIPDRSALQCQTVILKPRIPYGASILPLDTT